MNLSVEFTSDAIVKYGSIVDLFRDQMLNLKDLITHRLPSDVSTLMSLTKNAQRESIE